MTMISRNTRQVIDVVRHNVTSWQPNNSWVPLHDIIQGWRTDVTSWQPIAVEHDVIQEWRTAVSGYEGSCDDLDKDAGEQGCRETDDRKRLGATGCGCRRIGSGSYCWRLRRRRVVAFGWIILCTRLCNKQGRHHEHCREIKRLHFCGLERSVNTEFTWRGRDFQSIHATMNIVVK